MLISFQILHGTELLNDDAVHLLSADAMLIEPQASIYILALDDKTPIGAAALALDETDRRECHVISLFVAESYRKQGVGTQLLEIIRNYATVHNLSQINIAYQEDLANINGMFSFLVKNGYTMPQIQGIIYHIPVSELKKTSLVTMKRVPVNETCIYNQKTIAPHVLNNFILHAPHWANPRSCLGKIFDEMTLYYVAGDKITACVICELLEGKLNIHAAYTVSGNEALHLYALLQSLADMILEFGDSVCFDEITMNAINSDSQRLAEKLLEGAKISSEALQVSSYLVSPLVTLLEDDVALNHVWMQTISSFLTQLHIRHALRMNTVKYSDIVILQNPDKEIQIKYFMDDANVSYLTAQVIGEENSITYKLGTNITNPESVYEDFLKPLLLN